MLDIQIGSINQEIVEKARYRADHLIKPIHSLGKIEEIYIKLCGILGEINPDISKKSIVVFASDHGVVEEGVASTPKPVTIIQAINMTKGLTGMCAFAKCAHAEVVVVDIGIDGNYECDAVIKRRIQNGCGNIAKGPAMTRDEAIRGLEIGIEMAKREAARGIKVLGTGEMGIGNTTPSAAIISVMTGRAPEEVTGIGANLPLEKMPLKIKAVENAIAINRPNKDDAIDVLAKVGGYDIAGMAGLILGGAMCGLPVVLDGFISYAAALIALGVDPRVKDYLITSHCSMERGAKAALEMIGLSYNLDLDLRLGEGSGAAIMFSLLDHAMAMGTYMITFDEAGFVV